MAKYIRLTEDDTVRNLVAIATEVMDLSEGAICSKSRKLEIQMPRMVVSNICRLEHGIHPEVIAHVLDRDRTSIYHYEKQHNDLEKWKPYIETYFKVITRYAEKNMIEKLKFNTKEQLKEFLENEGIDFNVKNPQVTIEVKTHIPRMSVEVPAIYSNFSDVVKDLKTLLQSYEHKIQIII